MKLSITINGRDHTLELEVPRDDGAASPALSCRLAGEPFEADVTEIEPGVFSLLIGGQSYTLRVSPNGEASEYRVALCGAEYAVAVRDPRKLALGGRAKQTLEGKQNVNSSMPGKVVRLLVAEGDAVERGQGLIVVEAMKMQNEIKCPKTGRVEKILVREGQPVNTGEILLTVE
jgi:biotin carboxyl carrier protein